MRKLLLSSLLATTAFAVDVDQNVTFQATVQSGCSITNSPSLTINFNSFTDASGNFQVQFLCTQGTAYALEVGQGQNADGTSRRAISGSNFIRYRLYWDSGFTQEIGLTTGNTQTGTGNGNTQTQTIYARVLASENTNAPTGTYTDTLRVKVIW